MPFKMILETGAMVPSSNSYVDVDYATSYLDANIHVGPTWDPLDTLTKQQLLVWASRYLDQRATWNGIQTSKVLQRTENLNLIATWAIPPEAEPIPEQSMRWPRHGVRDIDGNEIPQNVIPPQLKDAVCEMARYLITNDRSTERPQDFLTELKASDVILKFRDSVLPIVPSEVSYILRNLGTIASGRMNFSKITKV